MFRIAIRAILLCLAVSAAAEGRPLLGATAHVGTADFEQRDIAFARMREAGLKCAQGDGGTPIWITEMGWSTYTASVPEQTLLMAGLRVARPDLDRWRVGCVGATDDTAEAETVASGRFTSSDIEGAKRMLDEFARRGYLCDANLKRLAQAEEIAAAHGVPVATVAMAYLLTDSMNTLAVVGMSSTRRILENQKVFDFQFAPGEREILAMS